MENYDMGNRLKDILKKTFTAFLILSKDLKSLRKKNAKLNKKIEILTTSSNSLTTQLKEVKDGNAMLTQEFNVELLADKDYQCPVCYEIFIKPVLLNCSHMFCVWCIDNCSKENNQCPICRVSITSVVHCLSMNSFIKKRMEFMPAKVRLEHKNLEEDRKEKEIIKQSHEEIFQLYLRHSNNTSQSSSS